MSEERVLCAASRYEQKYFFNQEFANLPDYVKEELQAMCVIYTEDVGGIFEVLFDGDGSLQLITQAEENDFFYDEIGAGLKIKELQKNKADLFEALELYYKVFFIESED